MDEEELDDDDDDDDDDAMTQTMLEIDYDTVIDDEDVVDEFCVFHYTINSELLPSLYTNSLAIGRKLSKENF